MTSAEGVTAYPVHLLPRWREGNGRVGVWIVSACLGLGTAGAAQGAEPPAGLSLSGSARIRYEALGGQLRAGVGTGEDMLLLRTTLAAEYRAGRLRFGAELYDSRAFGADRGGVLSASDVNALEPVQAYVGADLGPVAVQAGRMMVNLGSRRLVAADDYRNTTNGYTGLKLDAKGGGGTALTLVYLQPQTRLPEDAASLRANRARLDDESADLALWGGIAGKSGLFGQATLEAQYFRLDERDAPGRPTRDRGLDTYGLRLIRAQAPGRFDYEVEVLRQSGRVSASAAPAAPAQRVAAGFVHAEAGYQWTGGWKPHLALEYDRVGGDRPGGRYNRFDTLFGSRRNEFAPSGILSAIGRANIEMVGARIEATPDARWDFLAHYAPMWLDAARDAFSTTGVRDPAGASGRFAGHLVEGRLRWWVIPAALRFEANGAWIAKGRFLKAAPNAPRTGDTRYIAASLTATF